MSYTTILSKAMVDSMGLKVRTFGNKNIKAFQFFKTQPGISLPGYCFFFQPGNNRKVIETFTVIFFVEIIEFISNN